MKSVENFSLDSLGSEKVYKIVSKAILRSDILEDVLEHEDIGRKLYICRCHVYKNKFHSMYTYKFN